MRKVEKLAFLLEYEKKLSRLDLDGGYTGNIYPLWFRLSGNVLKESLT